jgi:transcriptional regulator with XRE-family HTH domain
MSHLGRAIRDQRLELRLAQVDLCERSGTHPALISKLERGYIPKQCPWLENIGQALCLAPGHLEQLLHIDQATEVIDYNWRADVNWKRRRARNG